MDPQTEKSGKEPFEAALDKAGFGIYNYLLTAIAGAITISFVTLSYGSTIIVPASACELQTSSAQQGLLVAVPVAGALVGTLMWGFLGDTRGRRRMLLASLLLASATNALASLSVNWVMLMVIQLVTVLFGSGQYVLSMTLLSECTPLRRRNVIMLLVSSIFLLGQGIMSVMAIPVIPLSFSHYMPALGIYWNSWRTLQVVYSLPSLLCAACLFFMQESPKYALARGEEDRALTILGTIHRINRRAEAFQVKGLLREAGSTENKSSIKDQVLPLFKPPYLKHTLIMAVLFISFQITVSFAVWAPTIFNRFMQLLETGAGLDLTLCQILAIDADADPDATPCSINQIAMLMLLGMCVMHSLCNTILSQIVDKAGRRNVAMVVTSVCGASGVLINLVPNAIGSAILFLIFSIGVIVLGFYTAIAVALFPTHLRTMAVATTMLGSRVASVAFIQVVNYMLVNKCELGFYIFASVFASSALVLALLPDDRRLRAPKKETENQEGQKS